MVIDRDHVGLTYGSGHVDLQSSYVALAFGGSSSYNIIVDSGGVHINGAKGATNF